MCCCIVNSEINCDLIIASFLLSSWAIITIFSSVDPEISDINNTVESCYIDKVRTVHSQGAFGSRGYQSPWLIEEAEKNLLRTHTTAVSARMLHALSKKVGEIFLQRE